MISLTTLTSGSAGAGSPATTASVSPGSDKLIQVTVTLRSTATPITSSNNVTVTGNGLTYVLISEVIENSRLISVFRAMGASPTTGALSLAYAGDGTVLAWTWEVNEWSGVVTTGTNGSGAVGTSATDLTGSGSTLGITITGTPATGDVTFAVLMTEDDSASLTPAAGWADITHITSSDTQHYSVYDVDQDLTESWTWTPSTKSAAVVGFIIIAGSGGPSAAVTGTGATGLTETLVRTDGTKVITVTLTGATLISN